jgi:hypothetical protein
MAVKPDSSWVRRSFLVKKDELDPQSEDFRRRFYTNAIIDYTDTRPGGSICVNPPASRCRHADIRIKGALSGSLGKGRAYKEILDDNAQIIHMRFGTAQHNSLTQFFTGFYSSSAAQIANTGRASNAFLYSLGKIGGFVVQLASWKLLAVHFLGAAIQFLEKVPRTKFYYSKPAMPLYWNAVTTIVNHMAVNRGVVPRVFGNATEVVDKGYTGEAAGPIMNKYMPTIFGPKGSIDVYALVNRAKRLERQRMKLLEARLDQAKDMSITDLEKATREIMSSPLPRPNTPEPNLESYLKAWFDAAPPKTSDKGSVNESIEDTFQSGTDKKQGYLDSLIKFGQAELDDGAAFASFRVNATGPIQDSFTSSVGESNLSSRVNGMSAEARSKRFDFGNGNIVGGIAGKLIGEAKDAVLSFGQGLLDSVEMSGLATLAGNAFTDIPKYWQTSSASLGRSTYTINLVSPYGNPISQILNIDIPLAMLMAGALPKSTGPQSFTSPFLVELYDQGRCQTRLGMIDSLTITRGTGNVGFSQDGKALGVDVTFSIVDMSSVLHMPISENFSFGEGVAQAVASAVAGEKGQIAAVALTGGAFTPDTDFSDYLAVLSGMALNDQIYGFRNLKLNITRKMAAYETWKSPAHMASFLGDTFPARAMGMFYRGTDKQ